MDYVAVSGDFADLRTIIVARIVKQRMVIVMAVKIRHQILLLLRMSEEEEDVLNNGVVQLGVMPTRNVDLPVPPGPTQFVDPEKIVLEH